MFDDIYECNLCSITPDIRVNHDRSKKSNIINAYKKDVMEIMVQRTHRRNFYREIITGILIPVYRMRSLGLGMASCSIPKPFLPYFIVIVEYKDSLFERFNNLTLAEDKDVKKYIEKHGSNPDGFKNELYEIFQKAEGYYEQAYSKNEYSDKYQVKSFLKNMRRR